MWLNDILEGALASGVNVPTAVAVQLAILACMGSLCFLLYVTITAYPSLWPHVAVLLVLAFALQIGMLWYVDAVGTVSADAQRKELFGETGDPQQAQQQQQQQQQRRQDGGKDEGAGAGRAAAVVAAPGETGVGQQRRKSD